MRLVVPLIFVITFPLVLAAPLDHLLRSPQFLLITQYKCGTIFESGIGTSCPQGITPHNRTHVCDIDVWTNLARDPTNLHPPKILYLGSDHSKSLSLVVEDIGFEFPENGSHNVETREIVFAKNSQTIKLGDLSSIHDVTGAIYDSNSQLFYLLLKRWYKNDNLPTVLVFFVRNIFGQTGNVQLEKLAEFPQHQNNGARFEWGIDASTHTVYYTNAHGEGIGLYSLPVTRLMSVLKEGTGGELVHSFSGHRRSHFRVSGELLFSYVTEKEDDNDYQFGKVRSIRFKEDLGMNCQYRENITSFHNPSVLSTIVVRDDDYCLLRYKKGADLGQCLAERKQWRADNKLSYENEKEDGDGAWCTILFIIVLVLAFLLVTSCFCLCWMKRNLDDSYSEDIPRSMPYYAAGRPGQYPEDVSVDRWNNPY